MSVIISPLMASEEKIPNMVISNPGIGGGGKISSKSYYRRRGYSFWSDIGLLNENVTNSDPQKHISRPDSITDMRKDAEAICA